MNRPIIAASAPPSTTYGPVASITCPVGATSIPAGSTSLSRQTLINAGSSTSVFCLESGTHTAESANTPQSGQTFIGSYSSGPAIIDGSGWGPITVPSDQAIFRAQDQDINGVTIKNLVLQNFPARGINSSSSASEPRSDNWTVEHCEIIGSTAADAWTNATTRKGWTGIVISRGGTLRWNYIHHCLHLPADGNASYRGGGFLAGTGAINLLLEDNQFAYNGPENKLLEGGASIFRRNYCHDTYNGIWFDGENYSCQIYDNRFEDINEQAIFYEISMTATIYNNTVRRAETGLFLSTSKQCEVYNNVFEDCWRGITLYLNCGALNSGGIGFDLADNNVHDNIIRVGTRLYSGASLLNNSSAPYLDAHLAAVDITPYYSNTKNNNWTHNSYFLPDLTSTWWYWGDVSGNRSWTQWQALPQDATGSQALR